VVEIQRSPGPKRHGMADPGTKSPSLRPGAVAVEGLQQHLPVVAVGVVEHLLLLGQGLLVTVDPGQHVRCLAVVAVQVG
jgi:hypothetical protein